MTNLESLKKLAENLGADASNCSTNLGALNVISAALGGSGDAQTNAGAIGNVADAAAAGMEQNVEWVTDTLTLSDKTTLMAVNIPEGVTKIGDSAFTSCTSLASIIIPQSVQEIGVNAFAATALETLTLPAVTKMHARAIAGASSLKSLILTVGEVVDVTEAITYGNPLKTGECYAYVPTSLVDAYKADPFWSPVADRIRAVEDYTVDGTTTGALDESKI